jgi:hypothetical protein
MGGTRHRGMGAAAAVAAVALAGAVAAGPGHAAPARTVGLPAEASYEQAVAALGACAEPRAVRRWADARETLAAVRHWREVVDVAGQLGASHPERTVPVPENVSLRVFDGAGPARAESVMLDGPMASAVDWALRSGARAYLALTVASRRDGGGWSYSAEAAYALVRHPDGRHFFAGACAAEALTGPARAALGSAYDRVLADLVGRPGAVGVPELSPEFGLVTQR